MIDAAEYREQGYALAKRFFDPAAVECIYQEARDVFASQMRRLRLIGPGGVDDETFTWAMFALFDKDVATFSNCGKQVQHLVSLHRLSLDEKIMAVLHEIGLGFPNISTRPVLYFNHPKLAKKEVYWRLSLHQDWRSMQGSLDSVVVWLPLVDINRDLGALEVLPGSHKRGLLPADLVDGYGHIDQEVQEKIDPAQLVTVEVERGDALFFSTFLAHQSGTNVRQAIRWSCHFRYNNLQEKTFIERGFPHPYIYHPAPELITKGFPGAGDVDAVFDRGAGIVTRP
jgi:phytanoyl-CoA hydroxylase